ncbi:hypothetical protein PTIM40_62 [Cyanophage P-TIM40]|uniref:DUF7441 domain-containing protein n=1 Tax=Cyanophage P-TIM40 TaxID=1589733 RepID=A0A0C5AIP4_9CAUD|nr:hypothetical protein AU107_gp062 [Cyanophage P-TIM40]AJK27488.1 hypothetical protein PTIM40_62 [Cyanophage P-TIM40]
MTFFTETSNAPYDRHHYKIICKDNSTKVLESWQEVQELWWNNRILIDRIEVIDKPTHKGGSGFG